jgi:hypothetical protein
MRPLHRPMFRYGGPIKEGVMSGIREPRANGGSMRNRALLVGNPAFPMQNGRALHQQNLQGVFDVTKDAAKKTLTTNPVKVLNPGKKLQFLKNLAVAGYNPIKNFYRKQMSKLDMPPRFKSPGGEFKGAGTTVGGIPLSLLEKAKYFARQNPRTTGVGVGVGMTSGAIPATVGGIGTLAEKGVLQIGDMLVSDKYFDQDKYMKENYPDGFIGGALNKIFGKDKKEDEKKLTADELKIKQLEKLLAAKKEPAVPQKSDAEIRQDQIQKYRDIMDIKGMNKEAAYDSLIAASQAINESGDFKGDIKSGKLINQIIQGASKAFDKPKATKDAIDTLILKGEIEKDLNKDKNAIMDAYRMKQIELADKQLNESLTEKAIKFAGTMKKPYVDQETAIMTIRDQFDTTPNIVLSEKEMEEVKKQDDYTNETDVFTKIVDKQTLGPGYYVMGSSGFVVDEGGNIKQIL